MQSYNGSTWQYIGGATMAGALANFGLGLILVAGNIGRPELLAPAFLGFVGAVVFVMGRAMSARGPLIDAKHAAAAPAPEGRTWSALGIETNSTPSRRFLAAVLRAAALELERREFTAAEFEAWSEGIGRTSAPMLELRFTNAENDALARLV